MKIKIQEYDYSIGNGYSSVRDRKEGWTEGNVLTPQGIVTVYAQGDKNEFHHTSLEMVVDGRVYHRQWNKRYTKRGIARKAREFARDLHE